MLSANKRLTDNQKRERGRPKKEVSKSVMLSARFTEAEAMETANAVTRSGQGKTEWIQKALILEARRVSCNT